MTGTKSIVLYDTLKHAKRVFVPQDKNRVTLYACGPTVYNFAHIGNARPAVIFDLLYKLLARQYPQVVYARNITDVDDKINASAAQEQVPIDVISKRYTEAYHKDMAALGVGLPSVEPRATDHIPQMIEMIEKLIDSDHAYATDGHVLFSIESFDNYGALSRRDLREMVAGARVEVADFKKHPGDFVLWKPSEDPQPGWNSPWGWGRPGWHLECSVMSEQHLGETIDIHGGGQDLVFPHHENEIAQSMCAHGGKTFAHYWMHNGFVTFNKRKISKSLGNTLIVTNLLENTRGEVLRYLLLSAHYRQPLDWSDEALTRAQRTQDRIYGVLRDAAAKHGPLKPADAPSEAFMSTLRDDLNTPEALAELNNEARKLANADSAEAAHISAGYLLVAGELIGLFQEDPESWLAGDKQGLDDELIEKLISERNQARVDRDFARADELRDQLQAMEIVLEDVADGTRWRRVGKSVGDSVGKSVGKSVGEQAGTLKIPSPAEAQQRIISDFGLFESWTDKYQYLIDLGKTLAPMDEAEKTDDILLHGCQSSVWLIIAGNADEMTIRAHSDAAIVSGLIALLIKVYSGASAGEILAAKPDFITTIGLQQHLSATRANGLHAMLRAIYAAAVGYQGAEHKSE